MLNFEKGKTYHGFNLKRIENLEEIKNKGYLFVHEKTGAELLALENSDPNKVFAMAFKTLPNDSTGLPHILEHSVLNGSRKFNVKDPFAEMLKSSLASFINAFTAPDKTVYPFASTNEKDFLNLMDVYLDSVLYPKLSKETFLQEGWHYDITDPENEIIYKGVVYNEMKGVYSTPDSEIDLLSSESLFPDSIYRHDSGGNPDKITDLTYEDFVNFHKTYYHPSNSRIFLYGDGNIEKYLQFINDSYLSDFEKKEIDTKINLQERKDIDEKIVGCYPVSENETLENKTYVVKNFMLDTVTDRKKDLSFLILSTILVGLDSAPLKRALFASGLGQDIYGGRYFGFKKQETFSIGLKGTNEENADKIDELIMNTFKMLAKDGFDKDLIKAALNAVEFQYREANFGSFPKGIAYCFDALKGWFYDLGDPFDSIRFEKDLEEIKNLAKGRYFEDLVEKYFVNNEHRNLIILKPDKDIAKKREEEVKKELSEFKKSLSREELDELVEQTKKLHELQGKRNSKEDLESLPKLSLTDVEKKAKEIPSEIIDINNVKTVYHNIDTAGIVYVDFAFDILHLPAELVPYVSLYEEIFRMVGTKNKSSEELEKEILINTGGIHAQNLIDSEFHTKDLKAYMFFTGKSLVNKFDILTNLLVEVMNDINLENKEKIKEIIVRSKMILQQHIMMAGHAFAAKRISSYISYTGKVKELIEGFSYYKFIEDLAQNFDSKAHEVIDNLKKVKDLLFCKKNLIINVTTEKENFEKIKPIIAKSIDKIHESDKTVENTKVNLNIEPNEGLMTTAKVQFVGLGANLNTLDVDYEPGKLLVLKTILAIDYLWQNVRLKGGAYGAHIRYDKFTGDWIFTSYRDPNLSETIEIYKKTAEFIKSLDFEQEDLNNSIIGTFQQLDKPLTPSMKGALAFQNYLLGYNQEDIQKFREQVLDTKVEDIEKFSELFYKFVENGKICVIGNRDKIQENKDLFNELIDVVQ